LTRAEIPTELSAEEESLAKMCGMAIRKGFLPTATGVLGVMEEEVEAVGAGIYHFCGSCSCGKWHEICNGKIAIHSPILPGDKNVIRMLKFLKRIRPNEDDTFVLEVCGSNDIPGNKYPAMWTARSSQQESLEVFCQMLLEIWYS